MKKSLFLIVMLLCMALFALPALATETECAHETIRCTGVCEDCGAEGLITDDPRHSMDDFGHNDTQCWVICGDCNQEIAHGEHFTFCSRSGECARCGETGVTIRLSHIFMDDAAWETDGENHWKSCACGAETRFENHVVPCVGDTSVCEVCGQTFSRASIAHKSSEFVGNDEQHWEVCSVCGDTWNYSDHSVSCENPGVCENCGLECDIEPYHYTQGERVYEADDLHHWTYCDGCGAQIAYNEHREACTNPGVCKECGHACDMEWMSHYGEIKYEFTETLHWSTCSACGEEIDRGEHGAFCDGDGTCDWCDYDGQLDEVLHSDWHWVGNEEEHWEECENCGEKQNYGKHTVLCVDPTECVYCGEECTDAEVDHDWDWDNPQHDETYHWLVCIDCGEPNEGLEYHWSFCDNPYECGTCGIAVDGSNLSHDWEYRLTNSDADKHWHECGLCGATWNVEEHYADCATPGVCIECEEPYTGSNVGHDWKWEDRTSDATHCWVECRNCDATTDKWEHYAFCAYPDVCANCGEAYEGDAVDHDWDNATVKHDDDFHWSVCGDCGEIFNYEEHYAMCYEPDKCASCGADYEGDVSHFTNSSTVYEGDDENCWAPCAGCGTTLTWTHRANCTDPGVCTRCKLEYHGDNVRHNRANVETLHDDDYHWYECGDCGQTFDKGKHGNMCDAPGVCGTCGIDYDGKNVVHYDFEITSDADLHYDECPGCGEIFWDGEHYTLCTDPGKCEYCGIKYDGENVEHDWDYVEPRSNSEEHWDYCSNCDEEFGFSEHEAMCDTPGVCYYCEEEYHGENIYHYFGDLYNDDEMHWIDCERCDENAYESTHYVFCDGEDNVCGMCGYEGDIERVIHADTYSNNDETHHWYYCDYCGAQEVDKAEHEFDDGKCIECGFEYREPAEITEQPVDAWAYEGDKATISVKAKGAGLTYQWYYKSGDKWKKASGTESTYSLTMTEERDGRQMKCVITDAYGTSLETNVVTLDTRFSATITKQPKDTTAYEGETAKVTVKATGDGITFQWFYKDTNDAEWTEDSATGTSYSVTMTEECDGRQVVCVVTDEYENAVATEVVTLSIRRKATIVAQPTDAWAYEGDKATISVEATGDDITYQWYYKNGKTWKKASGTESSYSLTMTEARDGREMKCVITDAYGNEAETDVVTLDTRFAATIVTQPKDTTAYEGKKAKVTVKATGDGLTYQWFYKGTEAADWTETSATGASYSVTMDEEHNGTQLKCVVTDEYGNTVESVTVTLSIRHAAAIVAQPTDAAAYEGEKATVTVQATGDDITYQWYYKSGSKWKKASGTEASYSLKMTEARDGRQMKCIITDAYGNKVETDVVTLDTLFAATITKQPKDAWAYEGEKAKVSVKATGDGLTYQWYYKAPDASEWTKASGAKASYSLTMTEARDGRQMKCVVTDKHGNVAESDVVTLDTRYAVTIVAQPKSAKAFEGELATTTIEAKGEGLTYQWYYKNPGSSKYKKSSITTAECSVEMTESRDGRKMYCVVTDEYGNEAKSKTITLSICETAEITKQPKSVSIAKNKTAKFTVKATGDGLTYQWYYKDTDDESFKKASGTSATYSTKATKARNGRKFYCEITDAYGNTVTTKTVKLTVK